MRRRSPWVLGLLGLVLVVGGVLWWLTQEPAVEPGVAAPAPEASSTPAAVVDGQNLPEAEVVAQQPGDPLRLLIPELDVDARVIPIAAPGGVLTPPADPETIGWWADGARPGERQGSALVTGHTIHTGGGALQDLEELARGDAIRVRSDRTRISYTVQRIQVLGKGVLADRAEQLFDQETPGRLVVVTCEDWDGSEYLSNVVVTAVPVRPR